MARDLEYKFFREFQSDGAAIMSLNMMHFEYCGISNELPARPDYPDGVLVEIRERTELFDIWPWGGIENCSPLMDEISDNIAFRPADVRIAYVEELLTKMQKWTWLYSLAKDKLDTVNNSFYLNSIEFFFFKWQNAFQTFAKKLAVILAKLGINLLEIQDRCGICIIERLDIDELWMDFGTPEMAYFYLSKFNIPQKQTQHNILTDRAIKYFKKACDAGKMSRTENGYIWKWHGTIRLAYFLRKIYNWDGLQPTPFRQLENLFGVKRLDSATHRIDEVKQPQAWRDKIDELFIDL